MKNFTEEDKKTFLVLLKQYEGNITRACDELGISDYYRTLNKWKAESDWFNDEFSNIIRRRICKINDNAFDMAENERQTGMIKFILTKHPEAQALGYNQKTEVDINIKSFADILNGDD
jgi:hypothetical protein